MFSEQVGSALAKDPPREALVTALVHPLSLNTALGLLLEAVMRNAHLVKGSATPRQAGAPKLTVAGVGASSSLLNHSCVPNCKVSAVEAGLITTVTVRT